MIKTVILAAALAAEKSTIANLMQLYLHDFSEFAAVGSDHGEVGADGRFPYERLDSYWHEDSRFPFTIRADGRLAGFALVNCWSALNRPLDQSVAEFFVLRKYRRLGVGSRAAKALLERFAGQWEVPVARCNQPALTFWRSTASTAAGGAVEECEGDGERWTGTVLRFAAKSKA